MSDLQIFIEGESINLCIPTSEYARDSDWYNWFNDKTITRFLAQGIFPNTQEDQVDFFEYQKKSGRLTLIISNKKNYVGVISLSSIDLCKKKCDIALVVNNNVAMKSSVFIALEAMSLMTQHAFDVMGIKRIEAGQHVDLLNWQRRMELIGYKLEGVHKEKFVKGREVADTVSIACLVKDYDEIVLSRGKLWDSKEKMHKRMKMMPKESYAEKLRLFIDENDDYYNHIFNL